MKVTPPDNFYNEAVSEIIAKLAKQLGGYSILLYSLNTEKKFSIYEYIKLQDLAALLDKSNEKLLWEIQTQTSKEVENESK